MPNLLITGLPRSGTTLACELLGSLPDTVALDEPLYGTIFTDTRGRTVQRIRPKSAREVALRNVEHFLDDARRTLRHDGSAPSKVVNGRVESRKVSDEVDSDGLRITLSQVGRIRVDKPLTEDFTLIVKHPAAFVALLPHLAHQFAVHAIVRNPLAILSSWQTIKFSVRDGRASAAERINPGLAAKLDTLPTSTDRQLYLLAWLFEAIVSSLPASAITRYEDMITSGGRALASATPRAAELDSQLEDRNDNAPYDAARVVELGRRLLNTDGPWQQLYPNEHIELMMTRSAQRTPSQPHAQAQASR
jgi:hypothetical protein